MDKSFIEKRIKEKANERFEDDYTKLIKLLRDNPIMNRLEIKLKGAANPMQVIYSDGTGNILFQNYQDFKNDNLKKHTNIEEIREKMISEYEKEETDKILNKLDSLNYLFQGE